MVAAKRDLRKPGVAYSQGQRKTDEFRVVSGDVYSFTNAVVNSEVNVAANSVLLKYTEALKDIVSPDGSKLLTLEAFSKLDMSSSLGSKTLVAARLLTNEDKTRGLRILTFNLSKDQDRKSTRLNSSHQI